METLMKVDASLVKRLREAKSWSQEHLATVAGVSHRTPPKRRRQFFGSTFSRLINGCFWLLRGRPIAATIALCRTTTRVLDY